MDNDFECYPGKADANLAMHGVPLGLAVALFDGRVRAERISTQSRPGEVRIETVAEVEGRVLLCVYTWIGSRRRAISIRPMHRSGLVLAGAQPSGADAQLAAFDWSKVDALTDEQIIAAAKADPDSALPTDAELAEFDLVIPAKSRRPRPKAAAE